MNTERTDAKPVDNGDFSTRGRTIPIPVQQPPSEQTQSPAAEQSTSPSTSNDTTNAGTQSK